MKVKLAFNYYEDKVTPKFYLQWASDAENYVVENNSLLKRLQVYNQISNNE